MRWLPGQGTDIHDHGGSSGGFLMYSGTLTEDSFADGRVTTRDLGEGAGRRFGTHHVHRVTNRSASPRSASTSTGPR